MGLAILETRIGLRRLSETGVHQCQGQLNVMAFRGRKPARGKPKSLRKMGLETAKMVQKSARRKTTFSLSEFFCNKMQCVCTQRA
jgi:hypothetical protein